MIVEKLLKKVGGQELEVLVDVDGDWWIENEEGLVESANYLK